MIIYLTLTWLHMEIMGVLDDILPGFPKLSELTIDIMYYLDYIFDIIIVGYRLLYNWFSLEVLFSLLAIVIVIETLFFIYSVVMWVLTKIPALGIDR